MRARCSWSDGTSPTRTPQVLRSMRMLVPPSRTNCTCAAVSRGSHSRTLTNSKLGKLPFTVDCTSAGVVYVLPADSFKAIIQHSSAGAEVGMDNTCVRAALPVHALCVRACGRSHAHPHAWIPTVCVHRQFLAGVAAFAGADVGLVTKVAARVKVKSKKAGGILMHRSPVTPNGLYVIRSGSLKLTLPSQRQRTATVSGMRHYTYDGF